MIMGPNDKRALRDTGRTWEKDGFTGPVMVDGYGTEYECFTGSVADITNGRLDRFLNRRGGPVEVLTGEVTYADDALAAIDLAEALEMGATRRDCDDTCPECHSDWKAPHAEGCSRDDEADT